MAKRTPPRRLSPTRRDRFDYHAHTYLTDGAASATDMWTEALHLGHGLLAITEHVALEDPTPILRRLRSEGRAFEDAPITTLVGVELTMVPPQHLATAARTARRAGAQVVVVHGETLATPVPKGTNRAAIECGEVDILAHPGLLEERDADLAHANGTILEISGNRGHMVTNGHVARLAVEAHADLVVDSDAHDTDQLLPFATAERVARGAGLTGAQVRQALRDVPRHLLDRCAGR